MVRIDGAGRTGARIDGDLAQLRLVKWSVGCHHADDARLKYGIVQIVGGASYQLGRILQDRLGDSHKAFAVGTAGSRDDVSIAPVHDVTGGVGNGESPDKHISNPQAGSADTPFHSVNPLTSEHGADGSARS